MIHSAAKASISRTRSPSACFSTSSTSSISAILSSVIVISVVGSRSRNPNLFRRSAMTASVTHGRALRYAEGSARGFLHHHPGHCHHRRIRDPSQGQHRLGVGNGDAFATAPSRVAPGRAGEAGSRAAWRMSPTINRDASPRPAPCMAVAVEPSRADVRAERRRKGAAQAPYSIRVRFPLSSRRRRCWRDDRPAPVGPHGRTVHRAFAAARDPGIASAWPKCSAKVQVRLP